MESETSKNSMSSQEKPSIFEARESRMTDQERTAARRSDVRNSCGIMKGLYRDRTY